MLQLILATLGLAAAAAACILGKDEMYLRQLEAKKAIDTNLILYPNGERSKAMVCELWSAEYVIGRRRRRCDLNVPGDPAVSKTHCVLRLDSECRFVVRPILHFSFRKNAEGKRCYYSEVWLNNVTPVPAKGAVIRPGDEVHFGNSYFRLSEGGYSDEWN